MTKALISIDYTVDFVADDGKLTAGAPAQAISEAIAKQFTVLSIDFIQSLSCKSTVFYSRYSVWMS